MRARATVEDMDKSGSRQQIIVTELPYQLNKARLIELMHDFCPRSFKFDHWCALNFDQGR